MLPALTGASNIYGCGMLELGMSFSLEQLVCDNDIIKMNKYAVKGVGVDDSTMAYQSIKDVGIGNDFLGYMETLMNFTLPSAPAVFDRNMYETWEASGMNESIDLAHEKVVDILANHEPTPLDSDVRKEMDRIISEADAKYRSSIA